jgi:hypothetical protein
MRSSLLAGHVPICLCNVVTNLLTYLSDVMFEYLVSETGNEKLRLMCELSYHIGRSYVVYFSFMWIIWRIYYC